MSEVLDDTESVEVLQATIRELRKELRDKERENEGLRKQVDECRVEIRALEEGDTDERHEIEKAVDNFLYCVDRPVGTRIFTVRQSDETTRAIIALHDAIGRPL